MAVPGGAPRADGLAPAAAVASTVRHLFVPLAASTLTTVLGLVPMALSFGDGSELRAPFAITVVGGLAVSMVSTLIFVPVAATIPFSRR